MSKKKYYDMVLSQDLKKSLLFNKLSNICMVESKTLPTFMKKKSRQGTKMTLTTSTTLAIDGNLIFNSSNDYSNNFNIKNFFLTYLLMQK